MADVSVRPAVRDDAAEIGRIQLETWRTGYAAILPAAVIESIDADAATESWRAAIVAPPSPRHHVLIAQEKQWIVGFAAVGPAEDHEENDPDPDHTAGISALLVEPRWGRRGHGGRLLGTAAAALRAEGATRGVVWVPERDTASRAFYTRVGWSPDGIARTLDAGGQPLRELRFSGTLELVLKDEGQN